MKSISSGIRESFLFIKVMSSWTVQGASDCLLRRKAYSIWQ